MQPEPVIRANREIAASPVPDATTCARRRSVWRQAVRFVILNAKIFKLSRHH
jgi:hypothetical protein